MTVGRVALSAAAPGAADAVEDADDWIGPGAALTPRARAVLGWTAFVVASVLSAVAARELVLPSGFAPWYPPAAFALAALIVSGWRGAPVVAVTRLLLVWVTFPDAYADGASGVVARAVLITAVYTLAAELLRRLDVRRARLAELGWFTLVGVFGAPVLAAASVALVAVTLDGESASTAWDAARTVWIGDAVAIATFVPFVLVLERAARTGEIRRIVPSGQTARLEAAVQALSLVLVPTLVIEVTDRDHVSPALVLAVLPAVWVALRRDLLVAAAGVVLVNTTVAVVSATLLDAAVVSELQVVMLAAALAADYVAAALVSHDEARAREQAGTERYDALVRSSPDLIVRIAPDGTVVSANRDEPDLVAAVAGDWGRPGASAWEAPRAEVHDWSHEGLDGVHWYRTRLEVERDADGEPTHLVAITSDTSALRRMEHEVAEAVARDTVTGLASAAALLEFCDHRRAELPDGSVVGLVVVDLDRFWLVRESLGDEGADELLRRAGRVLVDEAPASSLVARTGDSEFTAAVSLAADTAVADVAAVGDHLLEAVHRIDRRGRSDLLTASVGVTVDELGDAPAGLLDDARLAVRAAKELGRDRVLAFDREHRRAATDRRALLDAMRRALDGGEFRVLYQPEIKLADESIVGVEALVRWARPGAGLLPPGEFLGLAERTGLVVELGAQVLDEALAQLAAWQGQAPDGFTMAVNVSAHQLVSEQFVDLVAESLDRHGVSASCLRLELTETSLLADPPAASRNLSALRELGAQLALDDFGAGYASIGYLRSLPLDLLKIDQSFVAGLPAVAEDLAIVRFVIGLADTLGLGVTAEGIERPEQAEALEELGCRVGQGFLYDRPVPPAAIARWWV